MPPEEPSEVASDPRPGRLERGLVALGGLGALLLCRRRRAAPLTPNGIAWCRSAPQYCFPAESEQTVGTWQGLQMAGSVRKAGQSKICRFFQLPSAMAGEVVAAVLHHVKHKAAYSVDADSVDSCPTFEYYPFRDGAWHDLELRELLEPFVVQTLLPYVRGRYSCEAAALDDILVRRYIPGERRTHAVHFDGHALVTAVLGLCDPSEYEGGLYIQPEAHASSRSFFRISPGDLVVHSFDLQHGVFVWEGIRYSMVFWIKDSPQSVAQNLSPWYEPLAEEGDADALFNVAQDHELGTCGRDLDPQRAMEMYGRSAEMGHHFAQHSLSQLLYTVHREDPLPDGRARAAAWLRRAAEQGFAAAQTDYALALAEGRGVEQAVAWMRSAAEQLDITAACFLGVFCCEGFGTRADPREGARWLACSAEAGSPRAQYELGLLYLRGRGVPQDAERAHRWLSRAAGQGFGKARKRLAKLRGDA